MSYDIAMLSMDDQVRKAIRDSGMTRYAISKATGVPEGTLSRYVAGTAGITVATLDRLAPVIGVSLKVIRPKRRRTTKGK